MVQEGIKSIVEFLSVRVQIIAYLLPVGLDYLIDLRLNLVTSLRHLFLSSRFDCVLFLLNCFENFLLFLIALFHSLVM